MSRLDAFIGRMQAQRALLDYICADLNRVGDAFPGPVVELGLGNGRTYDHLKTKLVGRRIVVFDRAPKPNERSLPPPQDLFVGEIQDTAQAFAAAQGASAALVHADLGNGSAAYDDELRAWLPHLTQSLLRTEGWALSSTELDHANLRPQRLPAEVPVGRYFMYRKI